MNWMSFQNVTRYQRNDVIQRPNSRNNQIGIPNIALRREFRKKKYENYCEKIFSSLNKLFNL